MGLVMTMSARRFGSLLCIATLLAACGDNTEVESDASAPTRVILPINYIYHGKSRDGREIRSAVFSADFVCALEDGEREKLGSAMAERVAELLEDRRYALGAANILECMGPSAVAAVPALEKALKKVEPKRPPPFVIQPQFQLDYALRSALEQIRGVEAR
jgi:hypothetical protein